MKFLTGIGIMPQENKECLMSSKVQTPEAIRFFSEPPPNFRTEMEVSACYLLAADEILLLKRAFEKPEGGLWGVPGGKIHPEETPLDAALRELKEETAISYLPSRVLKRGKRYIRKPSIDYIYHMFVMYLENKPQVHLSQEHQEYCWISPSQANTLPLMTGGKEALMTAGIMT